MKNSILLAAALLAASIVPPWADGNGFTRNYGQWKELTRPFKLAYGAGAFDSLMNSAPPDVYYIADNKGILLCTISDGITPEILAEMIDKRYEQHPNEWGYSAATVLLGALIETCKSQINDERRKINLEMLPDAK